MKIAFTNANPRETGESFLLRFGSVESETTSCVLVDSGAGVDVEGMLGEDDRLVGILLTHAHSDHYRTLGENHSSGVPVFTSPDTARLLSPVLQSNVGPLDMDGDIQNVLDHVEAIGDGWKEVTTNVDIRTVPAGHTPGACGFVVRITDAEVHHMLITGDFTRRPVAGNPGLPLEYPVEIDAVFFNTATQEGRTDSLTASLRKIIEGVLGGGPTLVAADALVGIQYAHLIAGIAEERNLNIEIALAGQAAALYDRLDRNYNAIRTVPTFEETDEVLAASNVCIAGPCTLSNNSSRRLFDAIEDDPSACVVAIGDASGNDPSCVSRYPHIGHPSRKRAEELIKALYPRETIIEHGNFDRYGSVFDFCYTWAIDEPVTYRFYEDGSWYPPNWVGETTRRSVESYHYGNESVEVRLEDTERHPEAWPSVEMSATTPPEEGVDMDRITGGIDRADTDAVSSSTKYSTCNTERATDTVDEVEEPPTAVVTTDGGDTARAQSGGGIEPEQNPSHSACVERAEREQLAEAAEEFLDRVRPSEDRNGECESARATVLETGAGEWLLRIDTDDLDMDLDHQQTVTASIHTDG